MLSTGYAYSRFEWFYCRNPMASEVLHGHAETRTYMHPLKCLLAIAALTAAFAISAKADSFLSAVPIVMDIADGGATVMLLGGTMCGLVLLRHYLKR